VNIRIITGKTKVASFKNISLPHLKLCGVVLLVQLIKLVQTLLNMNIQEVSLWSKSTVVLAWLVVPPYKWKTFVENRVAEMQELIPGNQLYHMNGEDNLTDCAS
jgi:hypothetical protein